MDFFESTIVFVQQHPYRQQVTFLLCGIILGYVLHIVVFKLHLNYLRKKNRNKNLIIIQPRDKMTGTKKNENSHYFEYIKNAQYAQKSKIK